MAKKVLCPNCQIWHTIEDEKAGTFENRVRRPTFKTDAMAGTFPQPGIANQAPAGMPSMDTHVRIPLKQAFIFGWFDVPAGFVMGAVAGGAFILVIDAVSPEVNLTPWGLLVWASIPGAMGGLIAFCREAKRKWPERLEEYDRLLWQAEEITSFDLNGDGEIGEPPPPTTLKIELVDKNGIPRLLAEFDTDAERFGELARLILVLKKGFSEETASEAGYSRKEWVGIRDRFFSLEAATWKNRNHPKLGIDLRQQGVDLLKMALGSTVSPALLAGDVSKNTPGTNGQQRTNEKGARL